MIWRKITISGAVLSLFAALLILSWSMEALSKQPTVRRKPVYNTNARQMYRHLERRQRTQVLPQTISDVEKVATIIRGHQEEQPKLELPPDKRKRPERRHRIIVRDKDALKENERAALSLPKANFLWSDPEVGRLRLGSMIAESEVVIIREHMTKSRFLKDQENDVLQEKPIGKVLSLFRHSDPVSDSLYLIKDDPIQSSVVLRNLSTNGFMTRKVSNDKTFEKHIKRLSGRQPSSRVHVYDYSPKSTGALREMSMLENSQKGGKAERQLLKQWQQASKQIAKSTTSDQLTVNKLKEQFFKSLKESSDGVVIILFGHSDGKSFWVDTGKERVRITKEDIKREVGTVGELPVIVLLNCETRAVLAPEFLNSGSPLVFTSPKPLPVKQAIKFLERFLNDVNKKGVDAVDAIYDALKYEPLPGFGPISTPHLPSSTMNA